MKKEKKNIFIIWLFTHIALYFDPFYLYFLYQRYWERGIFLTYTGVMGVRRSASQYNFHWARPRWPLLTISIDIFLFYFLKEGNKFLKF